MKHLKIKVIGKVQGVWFRVHTKEKADELKLSGFVRNEPDGSVYIEVSGKSSLVEQFVNWIKHGPELSIVKEVLAEENTKVYTGKFEIRR